ncbi:MAG: hypothetical protein ACRC0G_06545 [Fusobacteriaceae bacterium]
MKKLLIALTMLSMTACSTVGMHKEHSAEKKAIRTEQKAEMKVLKQQHAEVELKIVRENNVVEQELKSVHKKEMKKVTTRQSIEFGALMAKKLKALKEFVK